MGHHYDIVGALKGQLSTMNENSIQKIVEARAYRKIYQEFFERKVGGVVIKTPRVDPSLPNLQAVHTPYDLCHDMVSKLSEYSGSLSGKTILIFNLEFAEVMLYNEIGFGVEASQITFITDCEEKFRYASRVQRYAGINVIQVPFNDIKEVELNMKFDVVIMNPPYQAKTVNHGVGHTLWDQFVNKSLNDLVKQNGYLCAIHPSGWRGLGSFKELGLKMKSKQIEFLKIHSMNDGLSTFGASTRYDLYVLHNDICGHNTTIVGEDGISCDVDLRVLNFIPNFNIEKVYKLIAKDGEKRVDVVYSRSAYGADKKHMSITQSASHPFPCIKYVTKKNCDIDLRWSSTNKNGHFGIPKVTFGIGIREGGFLVDYEGKYGLCQFTAGIAGTDENELENIKKALDSKDFREIMQACQLSTQLYNKNVISLFRKDFWKEFI